MKIQQCRHVVNDVSCEYGIGGAYVQWCSVCGAFRTGHVKVTQARPWTHPRGYGNLVRTMAAELLRLEGLFRQHAEALGSTFKPTTSLAKALKLARGIR
jgi:hypothetical protein